LWELGDVQLVTSAYAYEEACRNLEREEQLERLQDLMAGLEIVPESDIALPDDVDLPNKDVPILQAAVAAGASHLLTGDRRDFGPLLGKRIKGVRIMTPRGYFETSKAK
jgi:predicted nucleic acid-binding protein